MWPWCQEAFSGTFNSGPVYQLKHLLPPTYFSSLVLT